MFSRLSEVNANRRMDLFACWSHQSTQISQEMGENCECKWFKKGKESRNERKALRGRLRKKIYKHPKSKRNKREGEKK